MKRLVSVVTPVFNEATVIKQFLDTQLIPTLESMLGDINFEIVLVDDGSTDGSSKIIKEYCAKSTSKIPIKCVSFTRNFGKELALMAGIQYSDGDAIIMIDADGQHPVDAIPAMILRWKNGAKIVTALRKQSTTTHRFGSMMFYKVMRTLGNTSIVVGATDFRLIDREVADEYLRFTEHKRITRGLIDWLGYPQEYINVKLNKRLSGKASYNFKKLFALAGNSFISMSKTPLLFFGYLGMSITFFSLVLGLFILIQQYIMGDPLHLGWSGAAAMSVFISFLVGLVLTSQAMTALYISHIHIEGQNRPLFVVSKEKSVGITKKK